ncbi:hypothetical protein VR44_29155 [Streptomyces katrae]|uniref:CENP-V/GFA domain-containing protein n=2 Tax=Streptomyces katrae TaxID=68223 RepID=A0A0F4IXM9_9ACTN|nr:hypothetical protein VR44_29155 [Streptomyces katrae]
MDGLKWTGTDPNWFDTHPGKTARGFCGTCGSHLAARDHGNDMAIGILATALDHHHRPRPGPHQPEPARRSRPLAHGHRLSRLGGGEYR